LWLIIIQIVGDYIVTIRRHLTEPLRQALAGRMEIQTLWPFSQGEISGIRESFIDLMFSKPPVWPEACWRILC
jgi:hypothetical protein